VDNAELDNARASKWRIAHASKRM